MSKMIYHKTSDVQGLNILRDGKIFSPWYSQLNILKKNGDMEIGRKYGFTSLEDFALDLVSSGYGSHEIEHKVKCVPFSNTGFRHASGYVCPCEKGIVFEVAKEKIGNFHQGSLVIFVPKFVDLSNSLKGIYIDSRSKELSEIIDISKEKYNIEAKLFN